MKLVEILARELKYWNETTDCYCQDSCGRVFPWAGCPEFDGTEWDGEQTEAQVDQVRTARTVQAELASDYRTAIVTSEMWQSERERIAKSGKKANADGWIRHRGGKCPFEAGVSIEIRMRDGFVGFVNSGGVRWNHTGHTGDIMAYRIHKPAEQPINMQAMAECAAAFGDSHADVMESVLSRMDGPIQWRDRIREIDRTVEALEEERVSLIQRLEGEGFRLIGEQPIEMSDCLKWKRGDKVMANDDSAGFGGGFHKGGIYVMREDCTNKDHSIRVVADDNGVENGWGSRFFTFHSRPSA